MTAYDHVTGAASAVRSRITTNAVALGGIKSVLDRDEDPAVIADNAALLPVACVIPLGDKPDKIAFSMGSSDWEHIFDLAILGYYRFSQDNKTPFSDLNTVRGYSFGLAELFRGPTKAGFYTGCNARGADVDIGYYEINDYVIYRAEVILHCTMIESG